jgi:tRNA dimethylallyltransferase
MTRVLHRTRVFFTPMDSLKYMVLAGPTAVGKTDIGIRVAQALQTEIVGGDAFQLYEGLDILTGKPTPSQLKDVRHHLLGILPLTDSCDAHRYALLARETIATLNQRGSVPLVVGGTGFYLRALEGGIPVLPAADLALRAELNRLPTAELLRDLETRDAVAAHRIDRQNRRRILRALEVCISAGKPFSSFVGETTLDPAIVRVALQRPRAVLVEKINRRVDAMFEQGVVAEVSAVEEIGSTASQAIGFQLIRALLAGTIDNSACREAIKQQTRHYAKRQMTWFRRQPFEIVDAESSFDFLVASFQSRFPNR